MGILKFLFFIYLLIISSFLSAQNIPLHLLSSAGDSFKNTEYQLDWSIGEIQTETNLSGGVLLTQGFHQGTYLITAIDQVQDLDVEIHVFPNPVFDNLHLSISRVDDLHFVLTSVNGRILISDTGLKHDQDINMVNLPNGIYILNICSNIQTIKAIKIVKLN